MWNDKVIHMCGYHPLAVFVYYMLLFGGLTLFGNPYLYASVLISSLFMCIYFEGASALVHLAKLTAIGVLFVIINPLFSHQGMTVITYLPGGNALTFESIAFGAGMGLLFVAVMLMFRVFSNAMCPERWVELFGNISPAFALLISMIFRFIDRFKTVYGKIRLVHKVKNPLKHISILITYALETSVDTADSMAARGYGLNKRTHYKRQRIRGRDILLIVISLAFFVLLLCFDKMELFKFFYYPKIMVYADDAIHVTTVIIYVLYAFIPLVIQITEDIRWRLLTSKI